MNSESTLVRRRDGLDIVLENDGGRLLVFNPEQVRSIRLSGQAAALFMLLDTPRETRHLAREIGTTESAIEAALERFRDCDLLASLDDEPPGKGGHRRLIYRPPGVLEFSLSVHRIMNWADVARRVFGSRGFGLATSTLTFIGILAFQRAWPGAHADLTRPASVTAFLVATAGILLCGPAHELAHAVALVVRGGRVRRAGLMLFYGVPALFCDVTDAWRLDRRQRVGVALAGIRLNLFVAAISSLLVSTMHAGSGRQALSYIGFVNLLIAAINLCPLVKFDGYIAVVGWRDEPHLRARCMDEAQTWVARSVSGGSGARTSPGRVAFGVACAVAGPALVLRAFLSYESLAFASLGRVAGGVALGAETLGAIFVARRLRVIVKRARRGPVRAVRSVIIVAGVLAVAVTLLWGTSLSRSVSTVYVADAGRAAVVTTGKAPIRFGAPVRLYTAGVLRRPIGNAVVCGGTAPRAIPSEAGLAITLRVRVSMQPTVLACLQSGRLEGSGIARLPRGRTTLGGWIRWTLWDKPMRQLLSA